jgi:gluconolactonase
MTSPASPADPADPASGSVPSNAADAAGAGTATTTTTTARVITSGLAFPEGPAIGPDGELYVVEIAGQRISRVGLDGIVTTFADTGGGPNGCAFGSDGHLYVANNGGRWPRNLPSTATAGAAPEGQGTIQRIAPDGMVETYLDSVADSPLNQPNDICFDDRGGFYFTDPMWGGGPGRIIYCSADCQATVAHSGLAFPNGLGVTTDGQYLVVAESMTGMLWSFKIDFPGFLGDPKPNGHLGRRSVPDGFCFDSDANLIVAGHQTDRLFVFDAADGRPVRTVTLPDQGPTNVCFGGPDRTTLFVTSSDQGQILALDWPVPGMLLFPDRP